jgi:hypothetical protein
MHDKGHENVPSLFELHAREKNSQSSVEAMTGSIATRAQKNEKLRTYCDSLHRQRTKHYQ